MMGEVVVVMNAPLSALPAMCGVYFSTGDGWLRRVVVAR